METDTFSHNDTTRENNERQHNPSKSEGNKTFALGVNRLKMLLHFVFNIFLLFLFFHFLVYF